MERSRTLLRKYTPESVVSTGVLNGKNVVDRKKFGTRKGPDEVILQ